MATSQKHRDFLREPMGRTKSVDELPGIAAVSKEKLAEEGITKAYHVFAQFLLCDMDKQAFIAWFGTATGQKAALHLQHAEACYNCLREYADQYFA